MQLQVDGGTIERAYGARWVLFYLGERESCRILVQPQSAPRLDQHEIHEKLVMSAGDQVRHPRRHELVFRLAVVAFLHHLLQLQSATRHEKNFIPRDAHLNGLIPRISFAPDPRSVQDDIAHPHERRKVNARINRDDENRRAKSLFDPFGQGDRRRGLQAAGHEPLGCAHLARHIR